jgi:hypothetical protein
MILPDQNLEGTLVQEPKLTVELNDDPVHYEKARAQHERAMRNSEWLASHWSDLLPGAEGRFVAVAGQQAFVADTGTDARAMAKKAHPEDDGVIVRFVRKDNYPRIYADFGKMAAM